MKKMFKKAVAVVLTAAMALTVGTPVFAAESNLLDSPTTSLDDVKDSIVLIENALDQQGTSVENEFEESIVRLEKQLATATDKTEIDNLNILISNYQDMLEQYQAIEANKAEGIMLTANETETYYLNMILAAIAYFDSHDLYLCSELLTHGSNDYSGRPYTPTRTAHVYATAEYQWLKTLANGSRGSSTFDKTSSTAETDLFYSIHAYNYSKNSGKVTLTDKYDFKYEDIPDYGGLVPTVGNNMMATAQDLGLIVPYQVNFTFTVN